MLSFTDLVAIAAEVARANGHARPPPPEHHLRVRRGLTRLTLQNPALYNAAFAGYVAGVSQTRGYPNPDAVDADTLSEEAAAFALSVDASLPTDPSVNASKVNLLEGIATAVLALRTPLAPMYLAATTALVVGLYTTTVASLVPTGGSVAASDVSYVDTPPLLHASNVQAAIDVLKAEVGGGSALTAPFTFASGSPVVLQAVAPGQVVTRALFVVETAFNDPAAYVELGTTTTPSSVFAPGNVDLAIEGQYETDLLTTFTIPDVFILTLSPGASTEGTGSVYYWIQ